MPCQGTALQAAEKSKNAVIPSEARDPSWFNCPQRWGFRVTSLLGMTAFFTFSATSLVVPIAAYVNKALAAEVRLFFLQRLRRNLPSSFFHRDDLIRANILQRIRLPARPTHLNRISLRRRTKPKG